MSKLKIQPRNTSKKQKNHVKKREILTSFLRKEMSITFFPDSHSAKCISIQINTLIIIFATFCFLCILLLGIYIFLTNPLVYQSRLGNFSIYNQRIQQLYHLNKTLKANKELNKEIRKNLIKVVGITGHNENSTDFLPFHKISYQAQQKLKKKRNLDVPMQLYFNTYSFLSRILTQNLYNQNNLQVLYQFKQTLNTYLDLFYQIPLGRPFETYQNIRDTSNYGHRKDPLHRELTQFHNGVDMGAPTGTPIKATGNGIVYQTKNSLSGYGKEVRILHEGQYMTVFAHMNTIYVKKDEKVKRGDIIGTVGKTGRTTGPHLHYEVRIYPSTYLDPQPFICTLDFKSKFCFQYHRGSFL